MPLKTSDEEIYLRACQDNRFVVTINFKDFKKLVKPRCPGIIAVPSELSNSQIDEKLVDFMSGKNPQDFIGKAIKI